MENTDFNLWQTIRNEAEQSAAEEPMLASFLHMTVLRHDSLEGCWPFTCRASWQSDHGYAHAV